MAVFVSLIPFHCFTTETLYFSLRDITYQLIISCTRLYTFEKKEENYRKDKVWRQTRMTLESNKHTHKFQNSRSARFFDAFSFFFFFFFFFAGWWVQD